MANKELDHGDEFTDDVADLFSSIVGGLINGADGGVSDIIRHRTFIKDKNVVVSTVGNSPSLGPGRDAETMVFPIDGDGHVTSWAHLYFKAHGYGKDDAELQEHHERIVDGIISGSVVLEEYKD